MTKPIPEGFHTLTPTLVFKDARKAIEFYKNAFNAKEKAVIPGPNDKGIMHAELQIGDSMLLVGDETPTGNCRSAESAGQSTVDFALYVPDAEAAYHLAVAEGAIPERPVEDLFWGDHGGSVKDPFGITWWILTHKKEMSNLERIQASKAAMREMAAHKG
jgi:PhnB protein